MKAVVLAATAIVLTATTARAELLVPREDWSAEMANVLPPAMCRDGAFFRACFDVPTTECHTSASASTASCLRQYKSKMPDPLKQPEDGSHWGQLVGRCTANVYAAEHKDKKIEDAKCKDASQWK